MINFFVFKKLFGAGFVEIVFFDIGIISPRIGGNWSESSFVFVAFGSGISQGLSKLAVAKFLSIDKYGDVFFGSFNLFSNIGFMPFSKLGWKRINFNFIDVTDFVSMDNIGLIKIKSVFDWTNIFLVSRFKAESFDIPFLISDIGNTVISQSVKIFFDERFG